MSVKLQREPRERLNARCQAHIMNVLQRHQIHVTVEFVVRWEKILECFVLVVVRVAVTGSKVILKPDSRSVSALHPRVAAARINGEGFVFKTPSPNRCNGRIVEMTVLADQLRAVIPISKFAWI